MQSTSETIQVLECFTRNHISSLWKSCAFLWLTCISHVPYNKHQSFLDRHKDCTIEPLDPTLSNFVIFGELNQINFREINRSFILTNAK